MTKFRRICLVIILRATIFSSVCDLSNMCDMWKSFRLKKHQQQRTRSHSGHLCGTHSDFEIAWFNSEIIDKLIWLMWIVEAQTQLRVCVRVQNTRGSLVGVAVLCLKTVVGIVEKNYLTRRIYKWSQMTSNGGLQRPTNGDLFKSVTFMGVGVTFRVLPPPK